MGIRKQRTHRSVTLWNLFFQGVTVVFALTSGLVMVPLYVKSIPLDIYGAWLASGNLLAWVALVDPGVSALVQQRCSQHFGKGEYEKLGEVLAVGLIATAVVILPLGLIGVTVGFGLAPLLGVTDSVISSGLGRAYFLALSGALLVMVSHTLASFNQGLQSAIGSGLANSLAWGASLLVTAWLLLSGAGVVSLGWGAVTLGGLRTLANLAYLLIRWPELGTRLRADWPALRSFGGPLRETMIARLTGAMMNNSEGYILTRLFGPESAASFLLFKRGPDTGRLLLERPTMALLPSLGNLAGSRDEAALIAVMKRLSRALLWLAGLFVVEFVAQLDAFVWLWVGERFVFGMPSALIVVLAVVIGATLTNVYCLVYTLGNVRRGSRLLTWCGVFSLVVGLGCALLWGPLGYVGGVAVTSAVFLLAGFEPLLRRTLSAGGGLKRLLELRELGAVGLTIAAALGLGLNLRPTTWHAFAMDVSLIAISYLGLLFALSGHARRELMMEWAYFRRREVVLPSGASSFKLSK